MLHYSLLMLSMLGKSFSRRYLDYFFFFFFFFFFVIFPRKQAFDISCKLSLDNLHKMSKPVFWKNKKSIISLSSAELTQRVVKVNDIKTGPIKIFEFI